MKDFMGKSYKRGAFLLEMQWLHIETTNGQQYWDFYTQAES